LPAPRRSPPDVREQLDLDADLLELALGHLPSNALDGHILATQPGEANLAKRTTMSVPFDLRLELELRELDATRSLRHCG